MTIGLLPTETHTQDMITTLTLSEVKPSPTSVDDAHRVGHVVRHVGSEPRPQLLVDLLSLDTQKKNTHT